MSSSFFQGPPGIAAAVTANFKALFTHRSETFLAQGRYIDGANSRDPSNTTDVGTLQPGLVMGKISASGLYGASIIGLTGGAYSSGTSLTLGSAAIGTEIVRRFGNSGTFKLTGPPTAAGTVRTVTVTYSAISGTTATITAIGVNEVQTVAVDTIMSGGQIQIIAIDKNGVEQGVNVAYNTSWTQTVADIQTALIAKLGTSAVACAVTNTHDMTITFSGTGYAALPQTAVVVDISGATGPTKVTVTRTTPGVDGRFVTKSFIQPTDGSEAPLSFLPDWDAGVKVTDDSGASISQVDFPKFPTGGEVDCSQLVNYPTDASLRTWLQQQLSTAMGGKFTFAGSTGIY